MKARKNNYSNEKSERLEARLNQVQKKLIQHAADLAGSSLTDFVLKASQEAAHKIIREHEVVTLTAYESERFVNALINPPAPNKALKKAAKRYRDFLKDED